MNFINLQVFWWIPVILIFTGLLFWHARVRRTNMMRLILGVRATDDKHVQLSLARRLFRFFLLLLVMLMLIVAIARPTWKLQLVPYQSSGRDLMVLFDVSKSMLAQDIRPSRLAHAKLFLRDLVNQTGSDRFGLVAFAGRAFLECPMTTDKTSFIQYVDELDTQSIPLGGTNLQLALETAMKAFDAAEGNNRAIILITDGDELSGNSKLALAELKKTKIPLLIVGVGSSATPALIPLPQAKGQSIKFMRDSKGELVKTRLNVTLMQQLADTSGGYFVHSTTTNFGLGQIEAGIKKLLPAELEKGEKTRPVERFYYFLAFATILLWLWMLISEHPSKKRKQLAKIAAVFVIFILFTEQNTANAEALPKLSTTKTKKPAPQITDPVKAYNRARKIQLAKKGDSSRLYETAINLADKNPGVRTNSFNNLGVSQHQKARQTVAQAIGQVKKQNLDGAIGQLEGSKKILDLAEEMYVKALSTETPKALDEDKKNFQENARSQTAINQQLLLNDRVMINELIKKIKELKKQQKKAQKQTQKAQKQQQKKNKKQQQKKQQQQKQQQKKQQQQKQQQKKSDDELKQAQNDVKKLEKQAKDLGQKKMEKQAQKAKKELDKAEKSRKEKKGKKTEEHIKKALEQLKPKGSDKDKKKKENKGKGKKKNKDKKENKNKKKNKGQDGKDKKLPKPQEQSAQKAKKAPKDINPKEARKLLKLMTEKEKDFRKALKAHRKQQYKNIKVEKDW